MNELNFLDLAVMKKIDAESSVEKFGSIINTSFFETANLLGTIKIKGYISIESSLGGISRVTITDAGTSILAVAEQRAKEPIEPLDNAILHAVAGGTKDMEALRSALNIRSSDLTFHLYKLISQGFMDYEIRAAKVSFVLSEQGFNATGGVRMQQKLPVEPSSSPLMQSDGGKTDEEETEEIVRGISEPEKPATPDADNNKSTPPWVDRSLVKAMKSEHKSDVRHLLSEEKREEKKKEAQKHDAKRAQEKEKKKPRELTPEEQKREEKRMRMMSKLQYYMTEYAPYLLLLIIVLAIFIGAVYLAGTKLA
ncbi:MAG: hypothetical protein WCT52_04275 [Candidatus Micrarchaeia archaeon]